MATGVVKRLIRDKGFGFIRSDDDGEELFFHRSAMRLGTYDALTDGARVSYETTKTDKGLRAEDVRVT